KSSAKEQTVESLIKLNERLDQEMTVVVETADAQAKIQDAQDRLSEQLTKQGKLLEKKMIID
ncbi:MAG: hypothetical protein EB127_27375, partial [Alphaproteobacteria bacterium]|nr:hypothetical protein [Alphaproteobacteria bacterium]